MTKVSPSFSCKLHQLEPRVFAQLPVERRQRLVEQQHPRPLGERARERDALALAAGELVRLAGAEAVELDQRQHLATRASISAVGMPSCLSPKAMLPSTVRCGNSA